MPLESVEEGFNRWRDRAQAAELEVQRLKDEVHQLTEASRLFLNQRQEMAEERYAWQERGDRAEARVRELKVGRAAMLLEVADRIDATTPPTDHPDTFLSGVRWSTTQMRRLAAETPQPETQAEAHEPEHTWAAELHDPLANEWVPGTRYVDRDRAVNALAHAKRLGPAWKDGTPTERRLVRATTTYTVEPTTAPAVVQADGEAKP